MGNKKLWTLILAVMLATRAMARTDAIIDVENELSEITTQTQKSDELELEKDVENMEQFGEAAAAEETRRETERLSKEHRDLEKEIARLKTQNLRAEEKTQRLQGLYKEKAKLAIKVRQKAAQTQARKARSEKEVARLNAVVKDKEKQVMHSVEARKAAEQRIAELRQEKRQLDRRLAKAQRTIRQNDKHKKMALAQQMRLSKANRALKKKVSRVEARAH